MLHDAEDADDLQPEGDSETSNFDKIDLLRVASSASFLRIAQKSDDRLLKDERRRNAFEST